MTEIGTDPFADACSHHPPSDHTARWCAVITRPQPAADQWVQAMRAAGIDAVAMPLLATQPLGVTPELQRVWQQAAQFGAVMWVSAAAVHSFFDSNLVNTDWGRGAFSFNGPAGALAAEAPQEAAQSAMGSHSHTEHLAGAKAGLGDDVETGVDADSSADVGVGVDAQWRVAAAAHPLTPDAAALSWRHCRHWATGPGTTRALLARGVPPDGIDCPDASAVQFDSDHLWPLVQPQLAGLRQSGQGVLIVRGADAAGQISGRDWLAQRLLAEGVALTQVASYRRITCWDESMALALRERQRMGQRLAWVFSSGEALRHAAQQGPPAQHPNDVAITTHPRIAEAAHCLGWGGIHPCRPTLDEVVASIKSLA